MLIMHQAARYNKLPEARVLRLILVNRKQEEFAGGRLLQCGL